MEGRTEETSIFVLRAFLEDKTFPHTPHSYFAVYTDKRSVLKSRNCLKVASSNKRQGFQLTFRQEGIMETLSGTAKLILAVFSQNGIERHHHLSLFNLFYEKLQWHKYQLWLTGDRFGWRGPWGTTYAVNLRIFIDAMTEDQWVKTARTLRAKPPMPWFDVNIMKKEDLKAIYHLLDFWVQAVNQLPPIYHPIRNQQLPMPCSRHLLNVTVSRRGVKK